MSVDFRIPLAVACDYAPFLFEALLTHAAGVFTGIVQCVTKPLMVALAVASANERNADSRNLPRSTTRNPLKRVKSRSVVTP